MTEASHKVQSESKSFLNKLLLSCFILVVILWLIRSLIAGNFYYYGFFLWNMLLAFVPILIQENIAKVSNIFSGNILVFTRYIFAGLWLLFLPNAIYLFTDFMHLNKSVLVNVRGNLVKSGASYVRGDELFVVDSLMVFLLAVFGFVVAGMALSAAHSFFFSKFNKRVACLMAGLVVSLCSIGVYAGRFGRWNSWDVLVRPISLVRDLPNLLSGRNFLVIFLVISLCQILGYVFVRGVEGLNEQSASKN